MELIWIAIGWAMGWLVREALDDMEVVTDSGRPGGYREEGGR